MTTPTEIKTPPTPALDVLLSCTDDSARSRAKARFDRYGERTSPYLSLPEREDYDIIAVYQRADGTRYTKRTHVYRWGDSFSYDDPVTQECCAKDGGVR